MIGRSELWFNNEKMYEFATSKKYKDTFADDMSWQGEESNIFLSHTFVAKSAFTATPSNWYLLEKIDGHMHLLQLQLLRLMDALQTKVSALDGHHREPSKNVIKYRSGDLSTFWLMPRRRSQPRLLESAG